MQVRPSLSHRRKPVALSLSTSLLFLTMAACNRPPAPDVVATVNGKEIHRAELDRSYNDYKASQGDVMQDPGSQQADIVRLNILEHLIEEEILQQQAAKLNLVASDDEVNAKLTEMKALSTQEELEKTLKARNETIDDVKREIRRNLTSTKLLNKEIESKINITDTEIDAFYNAHKAEFNLIEPQFHLARIVVGVAPTSQNPKGSSDPDARKKIQNLHSRLESGEAFATVAGSFSEDPSTAANGGDLGFVYETPLRTNYPEVYAAVNKMRAGQYTDAIQMTQTDPAGHRVVVGYAIYQLIERRSAGQRNLSDPSVQQIIRQGLRDSRAQLLRNAYFETLRDASKVRNYFAEQVLKEGAK